MSDMNRASIRRCLPVLLAVCILMPAAWGRDWKHRGRKYKPPPPTSNITVTVIRSWDSKPVNDAAVIFQPVNTENKPWGNMELKTNENGKCSLDLIPVGSRLLLQVIAPGFRTYGRIYDIPGATRTITVKLLPPAPEVSIYKTGGRKNTSGPSSGSTNSKGSQKPQQ
jgi:hypothetical protein